MFPAKNGDCFLIEFDEKVRVLIDTGYLDTYKKYLKPHLTDLAAAGKYIDYCIITHIDADHIQGAVTGLFPENKTHANPQVITIKEVWHNSYRHLGTASSDDKKMDDSDELILKSVAGKGLETTEISRDSLVSASQGSSLASMLIKYDYPWNSAVENKAISAPDTVILGTGISCRILSPDAETLRRLSSRWKSEMKRNGFKGEFTDHAIFEEAYQSWLNSEGQGEEITEDTSQAQSATVNGFLQVPFVQDTSVTNASSIAFIMEYGAKKILFLADARPDIIVRQLTTLFPEANNSNPVWFECIKVSHHGSFKNNSPQLLGMTDSACYLFSTDGISHSHPDVETIAHVISRKCSRDIIRKLYFNYITPVSSLFDRDDWKSTYGYEIIYPSTNSSGSIEL